MSKRQILAAAKAKGIVFDSVSYGWEPTPGESVPCWSIYVSEETSDALIIESFMQLANTEEVLAWIANVEANPYYRKQS